MARNGKYQIAFMPGGEVLQVITAEEMAQMDGGHWHRLLASGEQMASPDWRTDGKLPEHGKSYWLLGEAHCTACKRMDGGRETMGLGRVMTVNTSPARVHLPSHWHAVWSCTDDRDHWSRSVMRARLVETGPVTH